MLHNLTPRTSNQFPNQPHALAKAHILTQSQKIPQPRRVASLQYPPLHRHCLSRRTTIPIRTHQYKTAQPLRIPSILAQLTNVPLPVQPHRLLSTSWLRQDQIRNFPLTALHRSSNSHHRLASSTRIRSATHLNTFQTVCSNPPRRLQALPLLSRDGPATPLIPSLNSATDRPSHRRTASGEAGQCCASVTERHHENRHTHRRSVDWDLGWACWLHERARLALPPACKMRLKARDG